MFSKACEYGIKAIIYIATRSLEGERVKAPEVAEKAGLPEAFTGKVLGALTKQGMVRSHKGPQGGFDISTTEMQRLCLSDIVNAMDGNELYTACVLGLTHCNHTHPCPVHHEFVRIRSQLKEMLDTTTIYELAVGLKKGESILYR